ncbi:hypothetical protein QQS21_008683 [Conoideocrella luteorostrata]|uniref:Aminoglycoside phosphotransferase domain-containing protein n=1 Tax=Conoideocrella luteorostrata TaxID=1105319 RepID=A0AAJ0FYG3_9HYPO|nr:hypothetical protein QQS21_008683 [Conoideocrella luteorostrata]
MHKARPTTKYTSTIRPTYWFTVIVEQTQSRMAPLINRHQGLSSMNILVDQDPSHIMGIVDWADDGIEPFDIALWDLRVFLVAAALAAGRTCRNPDLMQIPSPHSAHPVSMRLPPLSCLRTCRIIGIELGDDLHVLDHELSYNVLHALELHAAVPHTLDKQTESPGARIVVGAPVAAKVDHESKKIPEADGPKLRLEHV